MRFSDMMGSGTEQGAATPPNPEPEAAIAEAITATAITEALALHRDDPSSKLDPVAVTVPMPPAPPAPPVPVVDYGPLSDDLLPRRR